MDADRTDTAHPPAVRVDRLLSNQFRRTEPTHAATSMPRNRPICRPHEVASLGDVLVRVADDPEAQRHEVSIAFGVGLAATAGGVGGVAVHLDDESLVVVGAIEAEVLVATLDGDVHLEAGQRQSRGPEQAHERRLEPRLLARPRAITALLEQLLQASDARASLAAGAPRRRHARCGTWISRRADRLRRAPPRARSTPSRVAQSSSVRDGVVTGSRPILVTSASTRSRTRWTSPDDAPRILRQRHRDLHRRPLDPVEPPGRRRREVAHDAGRTRAPRGRRGAAGRRRSGRPRGGTRSG